MGFWCIRGYFVRDEALFSRNPFYATAIAGLSRPITASMTPSKRELSLANAMGQLDPPNRGGCVRERLEPRH
jgi:hypothetical protein